MLPSSLCNQIRESFACLASPGCWLRWLPNLQGLYRKYWSRSGFLERSTRAKTDDRSHFDFSYGGGHVLRAVEIFFYFAQWSCQYLGSRVGATFSWSTTTNPHWSSSLLPGQERHVPLHVRGRPIRP